MANTIRLKRSAVPGKVPTTSDLQLGELGLNTYDGKLYAKKDVSGTETIVELSSPNVSVDATTADILSASAGVISADDLGADKLYGWDDSAGKAIGFTLGTGLSTDGTTINASSVGIDPVISGMIF